MQEPQDAPRSEGAILDEYRDALRATLRGVAPSVAAISGQLEAALPELRSGEGGGLVVALRNLEALFALLGELARNLGDQELGELLRFDAAVRGFLEELDRELAEAPQPERVAARVESVLLPVLAAWPRVEQEALAAVERAHPRTAEAGAESRGVSASHAGLSVCMIVRDEAEQLPAALASLADAVDEIVVVDTGSRDATRERAREAGARVLDFAWCDDFAAARNASLAAASGAWCLVLDADERVDAASWSALEAFLARGSAELGRVTVVSETADGTVREGVVRVCRGNGRARFVGRIHEQLVGDGEPAETGLVLRHHGYSPAAIAARNKLERNERLLRTALAETPDDAFLAWQLGRTLSRRGAAGLREALDLLRHAVERAPSEAPWAAGALRDLGHALREAGKPRDALPLVGGGRRRHPAFTDLAFLEGLLWLDLGNAARMQRAFEECLRLGEPAGYPSVEGVGSYRAHTNLGLFCELSGDLAAARRHYAAALAQRPDFEAAQQRLDGLVPQASRV